MRTRLVALSLVSLLLLTGTASADSVAPPVSYTLDVGEEYVFVMLAGDDAESQLDEEYPTSGLYRRGAREPLWTVNWYAYQGQLFFLPDGQHMARLGPWPTIGDWDELAVGFYREGQPLREYRVSDLVWLPQRLPRSVSHYQWREDVAFDAAAGVLAVTTLPGDVYRFDLRTGEMLAGDGAAGGWRAALASPFVLAAAGAGLGILGLALWYMRRTTG